MLFNEPKLLKFGARPQHTRASRRFCALQRAEIAEIVASTSPSRGAQRRSFSALQRAEIAEIARDNRDVAALYSVSVLFNEPKLLKLRVSVGVRVSGVGFSALQRAEIAEIRVRVVRHRTQRRVSVLFNEPKLLKSLPKPATSRADEVSVLFNEPKLLKSRAA